MIKKILLGLLVIIVLLVIFIATRPATFHLERSTTIAAPPERVFEQVNDFHSWPGWSPWEKLDPRMKKEFAGSSSGTGSVYSWSGNDKVGEGRMTIERSERPSQVVIKLEFIKPWIATNTTTFTFAPVSEGTKVTWAMDGNNNFMAKAMPFFQRWAAAQSEAALNNGKDNHPERILVVVELTGGNDGLNTVVPFADDAYYRSRPSLGIRKQQVLKLDDHFGLHPSCTGLHRLFKDGRLAIVHGCGYRQPNLSHFTSMEYWHTAEPHGSDKYGWLGRFADARNPVPVEDYIVNIAARQSLAVASARHAPIVFKDPRKFGRVGDDAQQKVFETFGREYPTANASLQFVNSLSRTATAGAARVRTACREYQTLMDYGSDNDVTLDLKKVAALIAAKMPSRLYYLNMGGFDAHAAQSNQQQLLLMYLSDALSGFMDDMKRMGRADDVVVMTFTEFGRRVAENASGGTDHGTATPMFVLGDRVKGGSTARRPASAIWMTGT